MIYAGKWEDQFYTGECATKWEYAKLRTQSFSEDVLIYRCWEIIVDCTTLRARFMTEWLITFEFYNVFVGLRTQFMNEIESSFHDWVKINNQPAAMKINNQQNNGEWKQRIIQI